MSIEHRLARAEIGSAPQAARSLNVSDVSMRVLETAVSALALVAAIILGLGR